MELSKVQDQQSTARAMHFSMSSCEDKENTVIALFNQVYTLHNHLIECLGLTTLEGQAK